MGFVSSSLLSPLANGAIKLSHRVVMSPLTRMRARQPGNVPGEMNALYYGQRASAGGLIISEATQISQRGQGYPATPGIHSPAQVEGWRLVTDVVHKKGGPDLPSVVACRSNLSQLASARRWTSVGAFADQAARKGPHGFMGRRPLRAAPRNRVPANSCAD